MSGRFRQRRAAALLAALLWAVCAPRATRGVEPTVIPGITDPSPTLDGDLGEWTDRGVRLVIDQPEQVTYGRALWNGNDDLSAEARLGHDSRHLYVACRVVDDVVSQTFTGRDTWRGDHVMLFLDFARSGRTDDVWHLGISPGDLALPGEGTAATAPELVCWRPTGRDVTRGLVFAQRSERGYDVEAAIPWSELGVTPAAFQVLALDVALSDSDESPSQQKVCMSLSTNAWDTRNPDRLSVAGLGDRTGHIPPEVFEQQRAALAPVLALPPRSRESRSVVVDRVPPGLVPTLTFKARAEWPKPGGCIGGFHIDVNDTPLTVRNLANRPASVDFIAGGTQSTWSNGLVLFYGPDFEAVERSGYKPIDITACDYVLRLDGLIRRGTNTIAFINGLHEAWAAQPIRIEMADVALAWWPTSRFQSARTPRPAPEGPLPAYEPDPVRRVGYKAEIVRGGALKVSWAGRSITVESRFSIPGGEWAQWGAGEASGWQASRADPEGGRASAEALLVQRSIVRQDECILVRDTLTNPSQTLRPLRIAHTVATGQIDDAWLAGLRRHTKQGAAETAEHPSVVVTAGGTGFGLIAHDDVFRLHCRSTCEDGTAALSDNSLVLRPGVTYRHEWLVVPLGKPDYWCFVNALRRYFKSNFTIEGGFAFYPAPHALHMPGSLEDQGRFLDRKAARFVGITTGYEYKGIFAHGPVRRDCDPAVERDTIRALRGLRPDVKLLPYFNCFTGGRAEGDPLRWPDCQVLRPDGRNIRDGTVYPIYFPTLTNLYGREMDQNLTWLFTTLEGDGLFWDMYNGYGYHYGAPWDGWSADLDPRDHTLRRKKSATALISWPWRLKTIRRCRAEGRPIVVSGNPLMTSEYAYRFPHMTETADIDRVVRGHLFTPIALGDHTTTRHEVHAYRHMLKALDRGALFYWYSSRVVPTRPTLTSHMYPFTPIELHAGYVIGKERILTNRSGLFGWGDDATFETYVFDRVGKQTEGAEGRRVVLAGKTYAELRLPEGYSAAIVRQ